MGTYGVSAPACNPQDPRPGALPPQMPAPAEEDLVPGTIAAATQGKIDFIFSSGAN